VENYFNYFTEIEEHFQQRRGSLLMLSTLDWALIETWREAGVPLGAVLRGIDEAFDKHDARKQKVRVRKVNGLAYCTQEVMKAVEQMQEAAVGSGATAHRESTSGFDQESIAEHLEHCARELLGAQVIESCAAALAALSARLQQLAEAAREAEPNLEELERTLTVMEEKLFAVLTSSASEADLVELREQAAHELAPYRGKMQALQIRQVEHQFLHKRLLETYKLPRLSLFYMRQE